jgi:hypothetical protein
VITQLLQVPHSQWIYRCILVHDRTTGTLISSHKANLFKEIDHQLTLGPKDLSEEDRFLQECLLHINLTKNESVDKVCVCVYFWPLLTRWGTVMHEVPISSPPPDDILSIP